MNRVYEYGTSGETGEIRMPTRPATTALMTQFSAAMRSGEIRET